MSLHGVLSTLRELILDRNDIPAEYGARLEYFKKNFPELNSNEREDFAKISPMRIKVYTESIFTSQSKLLALKFPICFALFEKRWKEICGKKFSKYDLICEIHSVRPWRTGKITELVEIFASYISNQRDDLTGAIPWLADLVEIERCSFLASRAPSNNAGILDLGLLKELSVEQLMAMKVTLALSVQHACFSYDLISYQRGYVRNEEKLPDSEPIKIECYGIGARRDNYRVPWIKIASGVAQYLAVQKQGTPFLVEQLASVYLEENPYFLSEAEAFNGFFALFSELVRAEILRDVPISDQNGLNGLEDLSN